MLMRPLESHRRVANAAYRHLGGGKVGRWQEQGEGHGTGWEWADWDGAGAKVDELHLTPLELIDRIAALVPRHAPTGTAILACWHPTRRSGLR